MHTARRPRFGRSAAYSRLHKSRNDGGGRTSRELASREWQRRRLAELDVAPRLLGALTRCNTTQEGLYVAIVTDSPAVATSQVIRHADAKRVDSRPPRLPAAPAPNEPLVRFVPRRVVITGHGTAADAEARP
jgi:hypothetical protein